VTSFLNKGETLMIAFNKVPMIAIALACASIPAVAAAERRDAPLASGTFVYGNGNGDHSFVAHTRTGDELQLGPRYCSGGCHETR
jgi:hypothetical protein